MFLPFILILYVWQGFKYDSRDYALMNMLHRFQYDFIGMGIETRVDIGNARSIEIWKQDIYTGKKEALLYTISSYEFGTTQVKFLADLKVMLNISSTPYIRPLTSSLIYNNEKRKKISSLEDEGTPFIIFTKDLPGFYGNEMRDTTFYKEMAIFYNSLSKKMPPYTHAYFTILSLTNDENAYVYRSFVADEDKGTVITGLLFRQKNGKIVFKQQGLL